MNDLPNNYEYKILENTKGMFIFRIKGIYDKESALAWLSAYEEKSKFTWRISRTYPSCGRINIFRGDYRCHHNTDNRSRRICKRISKHTGCEAVLRIKIKRYVERTRSKHPELNDKEYPCIVIMKNEHNHSQFSPEVLRFRDISEATKNKLMSYFLQGYSASKARHALEAELMLNAEDFETARCDASLLPSVSVIAHLFNRSFSTNTLHGSRNDNGKGFKYRRKRSGVKAPPSENDLSHSDYEPNSQHESSIGQESDDSLMEVEAVVNLNYEEVKKKCLPSILDDIDSQSVDKNGTSQSDEDYINKLIDKHRHDLFSEVDDEMKNDTVTFDILDCDSQKMQRLLHTYSGKTATLDQKNMLILYYFANKYDMKLLKKECCDFIKESLSVTNICEVVQLALNHGDSKLLDSAIEYFGNNTLDILNSLEWQSFLEYNSAAANNLLIKYFEKSKS